MRSKRIVEDSIGGRIRKERMRLLMTQGELAEKAGITRQALSRYETNTVDPLVLNLICICQVLGVSADYLIGLDKEVRHDG